MAWTAIIIVLASMSPGISQENQDDGCLLISVSGCSQKNGCPSLKGMLSTILAGLPGNTTKKLCLTPKEPGKGWVESLVSLYRDMQKGADLLVHMHWSKAIEEFRKVTGKMDGKTIFAGKESLEQSWILLARALLESQRAGFLKHGGKALGHAKVEAANILGHALEKDPCMRISLENHPPYLVNLFRNVKKAQDEKLGLSWIRVDPTKRINFILVDGYLHEAGARVRVRPGKHLVTFLHLVQKGQEALDKRYEGVEAGMSLQVMVPAGDSGISLRPAGLHLPILLDDMTGNSAMGIKKQAKALSASNVLFLNLKSAKCKLVHMDSGKSSPDEPDCKMLSVTSSNAKKGHKDLITSGPGVSAEVVQAGIPAWVWPLAGAGTVLAAGGVLGSLALYEKSKLKKMESNDPGVSNQKSRVFNEAVAADVCFATGAGLAIWALTSFLLSRNHAGADSTGTMTMLLLDENAVSVMVTW
ncbi:MAG: hypothetical protein GXP49_05160 [Deltaproteobacteria bacterium]|nr:hypothetical protein [Deltaproteobacteria bacterium]